MKKYLKSIGPAIVVAAVVLGPGSILTSSKVGASFGLLGVPVIICSTILMIAMVALAARIGVVYEGSPCDELAARLGRPVTPAEKRSRREAGVGGASSHLLGEAGVGLEELGRVRSQRLHEELGGDQEVLR